MRLSLSEIARLVGGKVAGDGNRYVTGVSTDSRRLREGELFVPLKGERFDGHDFVPEVLSRGAAVMVSQEWQAAHPLAGGDAILVSDTLRGLGDLAGGWRRRFTPTVVGITGSNGKTTVKEMTASILSREGKILATSGNLNNLIGLPQMLLSLAGDERWVVLEMGMSEPGEIDRLAEIALPRIGVITNANPSHLQSMGSVERVALAKGELFMRLLPGSTAIPCMDDERVALLPVPEGVERIGYGFDRGEVRAESVTMRGEQGSSFHMVSPWGRLKVRIPVPGRHAILNSLAAATAARVAGASDDAVVRGLEGFSPFRQRFVISHREGVTIVDDTYNANPASMRGALETLASCAPDSPRRAILGEMRELGEDAALYHREVGRVCASTLHRLIVVAGMAEEIAAGAIDGGMDPSAVTVARDVDHAAEIAIDSRRDGEWILVKGSRGIRMERVVSRLFERFGPLGAGGR